MNPTIVKVLFLIIVFLFLHISIITDKSKLNECYFNSRSRKHCYLGYNFLGILSTIHPVYIHFLQYTSILLADTSPTQVHSCNQQPQKAQTLVVDLGSPICRV